MIGNDIVDLNLAAIQSNWRRKGFLEKVFTQREQQLISNATNSFTMVWQLWSMKESAYKVYVQKHKKRFFAPQKLECFLQNSTHGQVFIQGEKYFSRSILNRNYIYSVTTLVDAIKKVHLHCFPLNNTSIANQSNTAYHHLKSIVSKTHQISFPNLTVKKTESGVPRIYENGQILDISFSITHHGNYGAISILN